MWENVQAAPADAILGLTEAYKKDTNPNKVNLGVGVYKDDQGQTPVLSCVKNAEKKLVEAQITKSYLPISGDPAYSESVQQLLFGDDSDVIKTKRACTAHTPGGTGALRVGANLLKQFNPNATVWMSSPTWANHKGIFAAVEFKQADYPYYCGKTNDIDFDKMMKVLEVIPAGDIVLLHVCCHNPTGIDLSPEQWDKVIECAKKQQWIPFLDFAYQGFGCGVNADRQAVEKFAAAPIEFYIASSFSKNFGLYNERAGALTVVTSQNKETATAMSHLKKTIRVNYSNPPAHGGLVAQIILNDSELHAKWLNEVQQMRMRIVAMRKALVDGLACRGVDRDFSFIKKQRGMFSFSGLSDEIVKWLRDKKSIYIVEGGRINLAGLTTENVDYVCDSIAEALKESE